MTIKSISPFLGFDHQAADAANFYASLFPDSRILQTSYYGDFLPDRAGQVMVVSMELFGKRLTLLNGGSQFQPSHAFSFMVDCEDQAEIDRLWDALTEGGRTLACGWLTDRFGVSWQINYAGLPAIMTGEKAGKVMKAMMGMIKIDIQGLKDAAEF